jgi:hypothetical protein
VTDDPPMVVEGHETFYAVEFRTKESEAGASDGTA